MRRSPLSRPVERDLSHDYIVITSPDEENSLGASPKEKLDEHSEFLKAVFWLGIVSKVFKVLFIGMVLTRVLLSGSHSS